MYKRKIELGKKYLVAGVERVAVGPEQGAYCNDHHSQAFTDDSSDRGYSYYVYEDVEEIKPMTPFQKAGYTEDDLFEVIEESTFAVGSIIKLEHDDGSLTPKFLLVKGTCFYTMRDGRAGAYVNLCRIKKCEPIKYEIGDVVAITNTEVFNCDIEVGDLAVVIYQPTDGYRIRMLTGELAGSEQVAVTTNNTKLVYRKDKVELPFTPFTIDVATREEAELLKAIMHLHNKVGDSTYFTLKFTPTSKEVKKYMKDMYARIELNCPSWKNYK